MKDWIDAARLRTLPLSMSGIIAGSFLAKWRLDNEGMEWDIVIFILALLVTLCYQILSNYANDYGDGVKGTDALRSNAAELRAVASGRISVKAMRDAVILVSLLSAVATVALLYRAFLRYEYYEEFYVFLGLGALCILAAIGYTVGKRPYGYMGLGDMMVFIFFGLVSVCGSYFLFTKNFHWDILLIGAAFGMLSMAVLNLNNMRDYESDIKSGKKTLAVRLGYRNAMIYQIVLLQLPMLLILVFLMIQGLAEQGNYYAFIVMVMLFPWAGVRRRILQSKSSNELDQYLKQIGILTLVTSILLAVGLNYFN